MDLVNNLEIPQPDQVTNKERSDAMGAYLMMFASYGISLPIPLLPVIASVIYFYVNKKSSRFVCFHSHQSLISQLAISLLNAVLFGWIIANLVAIAADIEFFLLEFNLYFWLSTILVTVLNIVYTVYSLIACYYANKGRFYYFWFFGKISYKYAYSNKRNDSMDFKNKPPV